MLQFHTLSICRAIEAVCAHADKTGIAVAVSIVDAGGNPVAFYRMPGAFLASSDYARWKAWTSASFEMGTSAFAAMIAALPAHVRQGLLDHPDVTDLPGGLPIQMDGRLAGAVGISGGSGEQDDRLAALACETLLDAALQKTP